MQGTTSVLLVDSCECISMLFGQISKWLGEKCINRSKQFLSRYEHNPKGSSLVLTLELLSSLWRLSSVRALTSYFEGKGN